VEEIIALLKDENPKVRREACAALAKRGNPEAIRELVRIYENDENKQVKAAAAKALKKFAAQEGSGSSFLKPLVPLMTLSLVALLLLNVVLRVGIGGGEEAAATPTIIPTPVVRDELILHLTDALLAATDDVEKLRAEWNAGAGNLPCTAQLSNTTASGTTLVEQFVYPDLKFVADFDWALVRLNGMRSVWQTACASTEKGTEEQAAYALSNLDGIGASLLTIADALFAAQGNPVPTLDPTAYTPFAPTPFPSMTVTPSPEPTITNTPAPTIDPTVLTEFGRLARNQLAEADSLMNTRWVPIRDGGTSAFGCRGVTIGTPYTTAPPELLSREPDLAEAIRLYNGTLELLKQASDAFEAACQNNNYVPEAVTGWIDVIEEQIAALTTAVEILDQIDARGGVAQ
jgi:hypothetical protein